MHDLWDTFGDTFRLLKPWAPFVHVVLGPFLPTALPPSADASSLAEQREASLGSRLILNDWRSGFVSPWALSHIGTLPGRDPRPP
jgi:hypothetical protein